MYNMLILQILRIKWIEHAAPTEPKLCLLTGFYKDDAPTALKPKCRILFVIKEGSSTYIMAVMARDSALKAPNVKAQGNALGHAGPEIQALQGRHNTNSIRNLRPMERGAFCHALAGLGESVRSQTQGGARFTSLAQGFHVGARSALDWGHPAQ